MPKASVHKKAAQNGRRVAAAGKNGLATHEAAARGQARPVAGTNSMLSLMMPAMVALGCWGMAFTFTVFSTDPNHVLFGAMAALMALMWSVSFGVRARKVLRQK